MPALLLRPSTAGLHAAPEAMGGPSRAAGDTWHTLAVTWARCVT